jgi:uncharacterized protein (TIGR02271 family)
MTHAPDNGNLFPSSEARAPDALLQSRIVDSTGKQASIVSIERSGEDALAWIRVDDGPQVLVPVSLLALQADGAYRLPFAFDRRPGNDGSSGLTFPVVQEQVSVGKRIADTGRGVRINKTVSEQEYVVDEPMLHDELEVEHVAIDAIVSDTDPPRMRYEGDTLVVPVLEEVLVVQKQLRLREEVRITRHRREVHAPQTVLLRSEHIETERFNANGEDSKRPLA